MKTFASKQNVTHTTAADPVRGKARPSAGHAVMPLLQRKPVCTCDGGCPVCTGVIQPKLRIGAPNDRYEQEADRVADRVMRMPEPSVQRQAECSGPTCNEEEEQIQTKSIGDQITPLIQRQEEPEEEEESEEEEPVQAKALPNKSPPVTTHLHHQIQSMKGGGQSLSQSNREFFEPRFGRDFGSVRVHTGAKAAETAKSINARAFTIGKDIVFGGGQFSPATTTGRRLLAHELSHVIQQGGEGVVRRSPNSITMQDSYSLTGMGTRNYIVGILTEMYVGKDMACAGNYNGERIDEEIKDAGSTCSTKPRSHTTHFTIGQKYVSNALGRTYKGQTNVFYDAHVMGLKPGYRNHYRNKSCKYVTSQKYKHRGKEISEYKVVREFGVSNAGNIFNLKTTKIPIKECIPCP